MRRPRFAPPSIPSFPLVPPRPSDEVSSAASAPTASEPTDILARILDAARHAGGAPVLPEDEQAFLSSVADILAPVLKQAAYARQLESEAAERTRQIDRERRMTAR